HERRPEEPHVAGQADEIDTAEGEELDEPAVQILRLPRWVDVDRLYPGLFGAGQGRRIAGGADDGSDLAGDCPGAAGGDDRLHVGAAPAAGEEDADAH